MSKKNIDNLFQEKFRDFEEVPGDRVWNAIEASLDKKKKKRVIPIWWTLGGAAAALVIALLAFYPTSPQTIDSNGITNTDENDELPDNSKKNTNEFILDSSEKESTVVSSDAKIDPEKKQNVESYANTQENGDPQSSSVEKDEQTVEKRTLKNQNISPSKSAELAQSNKTKDALKTKNEINQQDESPTDSRLVSNETGVDSPDTADSPTNQKTGSTIRDKMDPTDLAKAEQQGSVNLKTNKSDAQNSVLHTEVAESNTDLPKKSSQEKKSIFDEIETKEEIATVEKTGRWSAGPNVAPVYYNAIGEGSPVNSIFNENSKSGNTNFSYGLTVAYALNDKLSIRSGINKVDYGYDTNDVGFSSTLQEASTDKLKNIDYASTAKNIVVTSQNSNFNSLSNSDAMFAFEVTNANTNQRSGTMAQQFGYLEVPLELDYALIDRKFGLNILGGVSSLFLIDNSVTLTSGELTTEIGEANNINSVNFSTNVGFGVNYKFTPKIRFNVEPVFKYQLNTFSDVSGDFRPFSIGVYSGLNFKF